MKCKDCDIFVPIPNIPNFGMCGEVLQELIDEGKIKVFEREKGECPYQFAIPQSEQTNEEN